MNQQLKTISPRGLLMTFYLLFSSTVWSRSDATAMGWTTYGVASEARAEFEATGKWPPMEKLISIEQYALRAKAPGELVLFNTLAGVPGTPLLKLDGEKINFPGFRLYAISRIPNLERAYTPEGKKQGGRFAILFKEENGKIVNMEMPWIAESEAQIILQQIGGFDPAKAPFVFEGTYVKLGGNVEKFYQDNNLERFYENQRSQAESQLNRRLLRIGGLLMLLIPVTWYVIRRRKKAQN